MALEVAGSVRYSAISNAEGNPFLYTSSDITVLLYVFQMLVRNLLLQSGEDLHHDYKFLAVKSIKVCQ
jgi:hypothetical protein